MDPDNLAIEDKLFELDLDLFIVSEFLMSILDRNGVEYSKRDMLERRGQLLQHPSSRLRAAAIKRGLIDKGQLTNLGMATATAIGSHFEVSHPVVDTLKMALDQWANGSDDE